MGAPQRSSRHRFDAVVVGAGFGGLGAALGLAERGARVCLLERLTYPGGCASTFRRGGRSFDAGATLLSGLGEDMLFGRWAARYGFDLEVEWMDPVVELRTGSFEIGISRRRDEVVAAFQALPGAPREKLAAFFEEQRRVAALLWPMLERPSLHPPATPTSWWRLLPHAPRLLPALRWAGRPLSSVVKAFGLEGFLPLRRYLDALCQITVQCSSTEAEAPLALSAMDYYHRGTGHVRGGVGAMAWALCRQLEALGSEVRFGARVDAIGPAPGGGWRVEGRKGDLEAPHVVMNLLPQDARRLLGAQPGEVPALDRRAREAEKSWGAAMLYAVARAPDDAPSDGHHLQLVDDEDAPFCEGNHIYVSISGAEEAGRAPEGRRTLTLSTHVGMEHQRRGDLPAQATRMAEVQARMWRTLAKRAPEWAAGVEEELTASPRTFERFVGRHLGYVGGPPRVAGLHHYVAWPASLPEGLHLVGDTEPPGQSAYACALGGVRVAEQITGVRAPAMSSPAPRSPLGTAMERARAGSGRAPLPVDAVPSSEAREA